MWDWAALLQSLPGESSLPVVAQGGLGEQTSNDLKEGCEVLFPELDAIICGRHLPNVAIPMIHTCG